MLKPAASEPGSKSNSGKIPIPKGISGKPPSNLQQYYVAVGSADDKMATLVDLLLALQTERAVAMALFTENRDSLDSAISGISVLPRTTITYLHEQQSQAETSASLANFLSGWDGGHQEASLHVLAMTNAGIKAVEKIKAPPLSLFVHFDLPVMKDVFDRRLAVATRSMSADQQAAIVVYFVVAGQAHSFRDVEGHAGGSHVIAEMPVQVGELILS